MTALRQILCPVDFSDASAGSLRYAAAIASYLHTRVIVLTVEDPLLTEAADPGTGVLWTRDESQREMEKFAARTFGQDASMLALLDYEVAVGKPAVETLRVARDRACGLIVISTHGVTGIRKLFFGSTTERVLRETSCPVLVTPPHGPGHITIADVRRVVGRVLVPVDLSGASRDQVEAGRAVAGALGVPLMLVTVVEPLRSRLAARLHLAGVEADRRAIAEDGLSELVASLPEGSRAEALVVYGDPAEEVAKVARDRQAGLIVMGLHGSPLLGPRMGSVTYRVLCLAPTLVVALPPRPATADAQAAVDATASGVTPG
jgi:nucleotide-binding universal stress UspA family protein